MAVESPTGWPNDVVFNTNGLALLWCYVSRRICAGQYIHADEAAKSRNKIFLWRSTIIALGTTLFKYIHVGPTYRGPNGYVRASL